MKVYEIVKPHPISRKEIGIWFEKRNINVNDVSLLASGIPHLRLFDNTFPGVFQLKKAKQGRPDVVGAHNWRLFAIGLERLTAKKTFIWEKLSVPKSVEMFNLNTWSITFITENEARNEKTESPASEEAGSTNTPKVNDSPPAMTITSDSGSTHPSQMTLSTTISSLDTEDMFLPSVGDQPRSAGRYSAFNLTFIKTDDAFEESPRRVLEFEDD